MTTTDLMRLARRQPHVLLACLALGLMAAAVWTALQPVRYTAHAVGFVHGTNSESTTQSYSATLLAEKRTQSYLPLVSSQPVVEQVRKALQLEESPTTIASWLTAAAPRAA